MTENQTKIEISPQVSRINLTFLFGFDVVDSILSFQRDNILDTSIINPIMFKILIYNYIISKI